MTYRNRTLMGPASLCIAGLLCVAPCATRADDAPTTRPTTAPTTHPTSRARERLEVAREGYAQAKMAYLNGLVDFNGLAEWSRRIGECARDPSIPPEERLSLLKEYLAGAR